MPGNHEYDQLDFDQTHQRLRATCERLGIIWLERETVVVAGVRFVGTSLWSDFDALAPADGDLTKLLRARHKAFRAADFYLQKTGTTRASPGWRKAGASRACCASSGCARRWRSHSPERRWR
jgi:hypothetical protein